MYGAIQNRLDLIFSIRSFVLIALNILIYIFELNNDYKYFIPVDTVKTEPAGTPLNLTFSF